MKFILVVVACALAASGCASPESGSPNDRRGDSSDSRMRTTGQVDRNRDGWDGTSGSASTARDFDRAGDPNRSGTDYDHTGWDGNSGPASARDYARERNYDGSNTSYERTVYDGVTAGGTPYRTRLDTGGPIDTRDPVVTRDTIDNAWARTTDADKRFTADIRTRIKDAGLSMNAQNATVTTENGRVTLRGRVDSEQERELIAQFAREVAGDDKVSDHLEVIMAR